MQHKIQVISHTQKKKKNFAGSKLHYFLILFQKPRNMIIKNWTFDIKEWRKSLKNSTRSNKRKNTRGMVTTNMNNHIGDLPTKLTCKYERWINLSNNDHRAPEKGNNKPLGAQSYTIQKFKFLAKRNFCCCCRF